jgi:hypothetical protein
VVAAVIREVNRETEPDQIWRVLGVFPLYGSGEALEVRASELPEPASLRLRLDDVLEVLERHVLVQAQQGTETRESSWTLTQLGHAALTTQIKNSSRPDTMAYLLDSQMATLSARLYERGDAATVGPFLAAARDLLTEALDARGDGDPVRWGAAVRAVHNAVVMDLDRPGSLAPDGGGLSARAVRSLVQLSEGPNYAGEPTEFPSLLAALEAREALRDLVRGRKEPLEGLLLDRTTYQSLASGLAGQRFMAHAAWVHLCRASEDVDHRMELSVELARAVTGVLQGTSFKSSDLALLTPDHREHLLLAELYADANTPDRIRIESTPTEALRRLASLAGALEREYPNRETRQAAGVRVLQLHTCFDGLSEAQLDRYVEQMEQQLSVARSYAGELVNLAQNVLQQPLNRYALSDLIRLQMVNDLSLTEDQGEGTRILEASEWVAVAERFHEFGSMHDANLYRFALLELLGRDESASALLEEGAAAHSEDLLQDFERASLARMLRHATSLMTILAQQDQVMAIPPADQAILGSYSHEDLLSLVEGGGGRFGVARIPWLQTEREAQWHAMLDYLGLRVDFPEDLERVSTALLDILESHAAVGQLGDETEGLQPGLAKLAEASGLPSHLLQGVSSRDAAQALTFVQAVAVARREGLLCTFPEGASVPEAAQTHLDIQTRRAEERRHARREEFA